jgi:hypothetical protein
MPNTTPVTPYNARMTHPKEDVIGAYIGFVGEQLFLFEVNLQNQTMRQYLLDASDTAIPQEALVEANALKGMAFNQVRVYHHPLYIEYYHVVSNTKSKKQCFWVKRPLELQVA